MRHSLWMFGSACVIAFVISRIERGVLADEQERLRKRARDTVRSSDPVADQKERGRARALSTIQLVQTIAFASVATFGAVWISSITGAGVLWSIVSVMVLAPVVFFVGEVLPIRFAGSPRAAPGWTALGAPLDRSVTAIARSMLGAAGRRPAPNPRSAAQALLVEAEREGIFEAGEREVLRGVLEFERTRVAEIMTPADRIVSTSANARASDVGAVVAKTGFSRIPARSTTSGTFVGMIHVLDLLRVGPHDRPAVRPIVRVDPEYRCDDLLREMRRSTRHLAIVEEHGEVAGMVTLEDLIEELVGDIRDEHDVRPEANRRSFVVDGHTTITEINEQRGLELPTTRAETVAGFVIGHLGRIPKVGDGLDYEGWTVDVLDATPQRVRKVRFRRRSPFPGE